MEVQQKEYFVYDGRDKVRIDDGSHPIMHGIANELADCSVKEYYVGGGEFQLIRDEILDVSYLYDAVNVYDSEDEIVFQVIKMD